MKNITSQKIYAALVAQEVEQGIRSEVADKDYVHDSNEKLCGAKNCTCTIAPILQEEALSSGGFEA